MLYVLSNLLYLQTCGILLLLWMTTWNAKPHLWLTLGSKAGAQCVHRLYGNRGGAGSQASAHQVHKGVAGFEGGDVVHQFRQALERHELGETKVELILMTHTGFPLLSHFTNSPTPPRLLPPSTLISPGNAWDTLVSNTSANSCI